MTISANYAPTSVSGDGTTVAFTGTWPIFAAGNLKLEWVDKTTGTRTTQTAGVNFDLVFNKSQWVATFKPAFVPPSTVNVVGSRVMPLTQAFKYSTTTGFDGSDEENSFDLLTAMVQGLQDQLNRVPQLAAGTSLTSVPLGNPVANKGLLWDPTGTKIITSTDDFNTIVASAAASAAAAASSASTASGAASTSVSAASAAVTASGTATTQAGIATTQANLAIAAAALASGQLISTSTTSNTIGTGTKNFTVGTGLAIPATGGPFVIFSQASAPSNYIIGQVTAYTTATGAMTITVSGTNGSGTIANWNMSFTGVPGLATGALLISNNLSDLANATTALTNLGTGINGQTFATVDPANDAFWFFSSANGATRKTAAANILTSAHSLTQKGSPIGADEIFLMDSAASFSGKKATLSSLSSLFGGGNGGSTANSISANLVLTNASNKYQGVTTSTDGILVVMPDATTITTTGIDIFLIENTGTVPIGIVDNTLNLIVMLQPGESAFMDLFNNATAQGVWKYSVSQSLVGVLAESFFQNTPNVTDVTITPNVTNGLLPGGIVALGSNTFFTTFINDPGVAGSILYGLAFTYNSSTRTVTPGSPVSLSAVNSICSAGAVPFLTVLTSGGSSTVLVVYNAASAIRANVATITGTTVVAGTDALVTGSGGTWNTQPYFYAITAGSQYFMSWNGNGTIRYIVVNISGTTVTAGALAGGQAPTYWTGAGISDTIGGFTVIQLSSSTFLTTTQTASSANVSNMLWQIQSVNTGTSAVTNGGAINSSSIGYQGMHNNQSPGLTPFATFSLVANTFLTVYYNGTGMTYVSLGYTTVTISTASVGFPNPVNNAGIPLAVAPTWRRGFVYFKNSTTAVFIDTVTGIKVIVSLTQSALLTGTLNGFSRYIGAVQSSNLQTYLVNQVANVSGNLNLLPCYGIIGNQISHPAVTEARFIS